MASTGEAPVSDRPSQTPTPCESLREMPASGHDIWMISRPWLDWAQTPEKSELSADLWNCSLGLRSLICGNLSS